MIQDSILGFYQRLMDRIRREIEADTFETFAEEFLGPTGEPGAIQ